MSSRRPGRVARALAVPAFAASVLLAQDPTPATPAETMAPATTTAPLLRLSIAGPAVWRTQFAPTNVGSLLASESGQALWQSSVAPLEGALRGMLGLDDATYAAARARLLDYAGSLEVSMWLTNRDDVPVLELRLLPDGKTDLQALGRDFTQLLQTTARASFQGDADATLRTVPLGPTGILLSEPQLQGDCVVAIAADARELAAAVARTRSAAPPTARPRARMQPPLALHVDVAAALAMSLHEDREAPMWKALGVDSLDQFHLTLGTAGPHVQVEVAQTFRSDERGLFAVLFPAVQGIPAIAALQQHPGLGSKVGHLDLAALYEPIVAALVAMGQTRAKVEQEMESALGAKADGILSHFTGECLLFGASDILLDGPNRSPEWGMVLRIRDHAAFAEKWQRSRKELGMSALASDDLGDGYRIETIGGFFRVSSLLGPDLFAIAYGAGAKDHLAELAVLAKKDAWTTSRAAPASMKDVLRFAPPGLNGVGEGHLAGMLAQVGAAIGMFSDIVGHLPELDAVGDLDQDDQERIAQLLAAHHLDTARSMTGFADRRWCFRVLW